MSAPDLLSNYLSNSGMSSRIAAVSIFPRFCLAISIAHIELAAVLMTLGTLKMRRVQMPQAATTLKRYYPLMPALKMLRLLMYHSPDDYEHPGISIIAITTVLAGREYRQIGSKAHHCRPSLTNHPTIPSARPIWPY